MKVKTLFTEIICSMFLFITTAHVQACYYEGDPVLTLSGYDVPTTVSDSDCFYEGDPVALSEGVYDNPVILAEGSYYYTADLQETVVQYDEMQNISEFSAFEHEALTPDSSLSEIKDESKIDTREGVNQQWTPREWYGVY